jgi:ferredoxin
VNELTSGPKYAYRYCSEVLDRKLDDIALEVSLVLQAKKYRVFPVPANESEVAQNEFLFHRIVNDRPEPYLSIPRFEGALKAAFSHRMAAQRAGLGWIGKSCSLVNPTVGPRLRLVTVLTDACLPPDEPIESLCGDCTLCVDACPIKAIKGIAWREKDPREARLDATACRDYLLRTREAFGKSVCGMCLAVCHWGKDSGDGTRRQAF